MREIVLDTETTGMDPVDGHRIVEIGCVELYNHVPTGRTWHHYINPECIIDIGASAVHGITNEHVKDKPVFGELVGSFLDFVEDGTLVIHNAEFDIRFLNHELKPFGFKGFRIEDAVDTILIARKKYPGQPANLDALCRRFAIDLTGREFHGALLDAQLTAQVYLELLGGRQHGLSLEEDLMSSTDAQALISMSGAGKPLRPARKFTAVEDELLLHAKMLEGIKNHLWQLDGRDEAA